MTSEIGDDAERRVRAALLAAARACGARVYSSGEQHRRLEGQWQSAVGALRIWLQRPPEKWPATAGAIVKDTGTVRGRGVFALKAFGAGTCIEEALVYPWPVSRRNEADDIRSYMFSWGYLCGREGGTRSAVAFGHASLYNGANPASMRYEAHEGRQVIRFVAARDIAPGEELTINYSGDRGSPVSDGNWWFEKKGLLFLP